MTATEGLDTLIRLRRWELDEKRRTVRELEDFVTRLEEEASRLEVELVTEQESARRSPEALCAYSGYAQAVISRRAALASSVAQVEEQLDVARDEVHQAFQELKRFEIAREREEAADNARGKRRQQADLDEIARNIYRRRTG